MGGGAMRAAAKLAGVPAVTGGIRGMAAEHLPASSSSRRTISVRRAAATASSGEEGKLVSSQSQKTDDWAYGGGEETVVVGGAGEQMPRVVFDRAPTLQEAVEATSELTLAIEKLYLSTHDSVGYEDSVNAKHDLNSSLSNSQVDRSKACVIGEISMAPAVSASAFKAFKFLQESPAVQNVVASVARDPNVWTAVLMNQELQEFLYSQNTDSVTGDDQLDELSVKSIEESSNVAESEQGTSFAQKIKVTLAEMMNNLSGFFQNLFGDHGAEESAKSDGAPTLSAEPIMGASVLGLAIMAIMVIFLKRG